MNKGLKLVYCKECKRKRFCSKVRIPDFNFRWTCSKGHTWIEVGATLSRINLVLQDVMSEKLLKNLFERDDTFFRALKNK